MPEEKTVIHRYRSSPFVLDKAKLARILDIMEQRFTEASLDFQPTFDIILKKGRHIKTGNVDQLLGFDNSVGNPISDLVITAEGLKENDLSIQLEFDNSRRGNIHLEVSSSDSKRASQSFAELEEQVERTLTSGWIYKITLFNVLVTIMLLFFLAFFLVLVFVPRSAIKSNARYLLTRDEINSFIKQGSTATTTDEKINLLLTLQTQQLERSLNNPDEVIIRGEDFKRLFTLKALFISLPVILIITCLIYLRKYSYPTAVFLWGDWEDHYTKMLSIRKTIWTVIILSSFVGILSNLFVYALYSN